MGNAGSVEKYACPKPDPSVPYPYREMRCTKIPGGLYEDKIRCERDCVVPEDVTELLKAIDESEPKGFHHPFSADFRAEVRASSDGFLEFMRDGLDHISSPLFSLDARTFQVAFSGWPVHIASPWVISGPPTERSEKVMAEVRAAMARQTAKRIEIVSDPRLAYPTQDDTKTFATLLGFKGPLCDISECEFPDRDHLREVVDAISEGRERFIFIPIELRWPGPTSGHAGAIVYDGDHHRSYYMDPNGFWDGASLAHAIFTLFMLLSRRLIPDLTYNPTYIFRNICQAGDRLVPKDSGYCATWHVLMAILYILNPEYGFDRLIMMFRQIVFDFESLYISFFSYLVYSTFADERIRNAVASLKTSYQNMISYAQEKVRLGGASIPAGKVTFIQDLASSRLSFHFASGLVTHTSPTDLGAVDKKLRDSVDLYFAMSGTDLEDQFIGHIGTHLSRFIIKDAILFPRSRKSYS